MAKLPKPDCELGYTDKQVDTIMGLRMAEFQRWMAGQTMAICDGRRFSYAENRYEATGCGPHGYITYPWDLQRFLDGKPIID